MTFYQSISDQYRKIFPLNLMQVRFVESHISGFPKLSLLDIGCGTGDLTSELSKSFNQVVGIDVDNAMLSEARSESEQLEKVENIKFLRLNMLDIQQQFGHDAFDTILCFGNTLVHLENLVDVSDFIEQTGSVLRKGGKLLIQIINYDRILDQNIPSLPTIETNEIRFVRNYHYLKKLHLIDFETILTIKNSNRHIRNKVRLLPIRQSEIESILLDTGFKAIRYFGSFKGDPLQANSVPLIIEASL